MGNFVGDFYGGKSAGGIGKYTPVGMVSSMFGGGKDEIEPRPDYPYMSAGNLYDWANQYQGKYDYDPAKPYQGQLTAGQTSQEKQAQSSLSGYTGSPTGGALNEATDYTKGVLKGGYDPRTSPYYTAMKQQILQDAGEAGSAVRHESARSGMLHSDPRHDQERKLTENTSSMLAQLLGGMYETERGRMGQAAQLAPTLARAESDIPLQKIGAGATIGAIPREVDQAGLGREYSEYQRQVAGAREPLNIYENLSGKSYNPYDAQPYQAGQNVGGDMAGTLMKALPYLMMMI